MDFDERHVTKTRVADAQTVMCLAMEILMVDVPGMRGGVIEELKLGLRKTGTQEFFEAL